MLEERRSADRRRSWVDVDDDRRSGGDRRRDQHMGLRPRRWGEQQEDQYVDRRRSRAVKLFITVEGDVFMGITMSDMQQVSVTISAQDAAGNPATISGVPTWVVDDVTIATVAPALDGMSAVIRAAGPTGTATVTATVVANATTLSGSLVVTIIGGAPISLVLTPGTPTAQA